MGGGTRLDTSAPAVRVARDMMRPMGLSAIALSATPENKKTLATSTHTEKPGLKLVIGAGVTLGYEFALGHALEFVKIVKQTSPNKSYLQVINGIVSKKGVAGIWDGFMPWGAVQGVFKGAVFSWGHATTRKVVQPLVDNQTISVGVAEVLAGGAGGGFQGFVLSPTLLLKTRVMTDPVFRLNMTPLETSKKSLEIGMKVIHQEGIAALMKGSIVFSMKRVADWSTRFFFSVLAENLLYKRKDPTYQLTTSEKMTASLLGGVGSTVCTLPIDVMVAQIQQASKAGAQVGVMETFKQEFKQGGIKQVAGFATNGFVARVAHVCFTTMIMKTATSVVYDAIEGK